MGLYTENDLVQMDHGKQGKDRPIHLEGLNDSR